MNKLNLLAIGFASALLVGCASVPMTSASLDASAKRATPEFGQANSFATFENQTDAAASIKVLGAETRQVSVKAKGSERLKLKGGEYYFKVRFDSLGEPKYAVGPFFDLLDVGGLKHEVTITLKFPQLAGLYEISKEQFESESGDPAMLRMANSMSKSWVQWASIVLAIVTEEHEEKSQMIFKLMAQYGKQPITSKDYQGLNLDALAEGAKISIRDIIKAHGQPSARRTVKQSVNPQTKEELEFDVYDFDAIELLCRKGSDDVEWLNAPTMWFIEGIRKKAQRTLERTK